MGRERELAEGRAADFCHDVNRDLEEQFRAQCRDAAKLATGMSAPSGSSATPLPLPPPPSPPMPPPSSSPGSSSMVAAPRYVDFRERFASRDKD